jgi:hypothetical protein
MKIWNFIKRNKIVIGAVWGISTTCISLWLGFFPPEQNSKLTFIQKSKFDAFTIEEPINELQILFNGKDIRENNLNLKIFKFKLINNGKRDIKETDFVKEIPFGVNIEKGKLVRVAIGKSNNYEFGKSFKNNKYQDSLGVVFKKLFIGKGEYVFFDLWVIHKKNLDPKASVQGRISDTEIEKTEVDETYDTIWVDLFKGVAALGLILFCGWLLIIVLTFVANFIEKYYRLFCIKNKLDHYYDDSNKSHRLLVKLYTLVGRRSFIDVMNILIDREKTNKTYNEESESKITVNDFFDLYDKKKITTSNPIKKIDYTSDFLKIIGILKESDILENSIDDSMIVVKQDFINEIVSMLKLI